MSWLLTGGAGYIGSHIAHQFVEAGESVVILDNLSTGLMERIPKSATFVKGDITSDSDLAKVFKSHAIEGVINLAALKSVAESELFPDEYELVNSRGAAQVLKHSIKNGAQFFIQSSTAAVYGNPESGVAYESTAPHPISVYGRTKLAAEEELTGAMSKNSISGTSLRFFNVVGARNKTLKDNSAANLFPIVMRALSAGNRPQVFGGDYETHDGTCIRDYVHVEDIALAHLLTARALRENTLPPSINLGTGSGFSVLEVISALQKSSGTSFDPEMLPRRFGDPAELTANVELAEAVIGFKSVRNLNDMVSSTFI
jgi:UDP-glucose 4-epimerase